MVCAGSGSPNQELGFVNTTASFSVPHQKPKTPCFPVPNPSKWAITLGPKRSSSSSEKDAALKSEGSGGVALAKVVTDTFSDAALTQIPNYWQSKCND